ncbi:LicD family protein [Methanobrevibacter sp.]
MGIKQKIGNTILNSSGSVKHYKKQIEKLTKKVERLEKENKSTNRLMNTLFLDYNLTPSPLLQNFRDLSLELLRFMDNICIKYDLEWWMRGGTFLGAIRHDGFIPWDDDMDTGIMRNDYDKFVDVLPEELKRNNLDNKIKINFRQRNAFVQGATSFLQLFYYNTLSGGGVDLTALDIFPFDYMKEYNGEDFGQLYEDVRLQYYHDLVDTGDYEYSINKVYESLNLTREKTPYMLNGVEGSAGPNRLNKLQVFETEGIQPFKRVMFCKYEFPGPKDKDYYLNNYYGDYWKVPRVLTFHQRMGRLRKYPDIVDIMENEAIYLKEVNDDFE